ncbi:putative sodium/metabolite cotransporter BASS6 chloroplastic [Zea mays]|uniref:Putative sodium/metabolite cotransporter BASS6 chloroplastic n=1 Tax=Zea mays TaxID=4577 RepID=A0A1D6I8W0_MAIZE|nr:putative sodium/metabolite cotransporter BASS6 chloroplastic [Zea mays]
MAPAPALTATSVLKRSHLPGVHSLACRRQPGADRVSVLSPAIPPPRVSWQQGSGVVAKRLLWASASGSFEKDNIGEDAVLPSQIAVENKVDFLKILKSANSIIPHIVLGSTILALVYPPSFTWFTTRYYAPALGFLMFAVGVNSSAKDFIEAIKRPDAIAAGYIGQFVIKPLFGFLFGTLAVAVLNLPAALGKKLSSCIFICFRISIAAYVVNSDVNLSVGAGIMLVSCVSGAQLSNYATFLTDPHMAPLSIVMTSLSTATAVFVTPTLSYFLIGQKLPVDVKGMMSSIVQIVVAPIAAGLLLNSLLALALANKFFPDPLVGVPPAISVVLMSLMGFALVMVWSKKREA